MFKHMKNLVLLVLLMLGASLGSSLCAQGFTPPAEGNAVIYFVRVSNFGGAASFEYFRDDRFIGIFKGKNYMRYECPPGKSLFWVSSEDKEFLDCDLEAGQTYVVLVNIEMGAWKANVGLEPITPENEDFPRVKELVKSEPPVITSPEKIKDTEAKLKERRFVENILERYESEWKNSKHTKKVTREMSIPADKLQ